MLHSSVTSRKGFSILMALWTTGILLIIMIGITSLYLNEMKLSRLQYDGIVAYAQAEWAFEYAMLKTVNHREWFQDAMTAEDPDGKVFFWISDRTKSVKTNYSIESHATDKIFTIDPSGHLIVPLFTWVGTPIGSRASRSPLYETSTTTVSSLDLSVGSSSDIGWSIVAMDSGKNISMAGSGSIDISKTGTVRTRWIDCYDSSGIQKPVSIPLNLNGSCPDPYNEMNNGQSIEYYFDKEMKVSDFLNSGYTDPYLLIFNNSSSTQDVHMNTNTPFALPSLTVIAESRKGNALQSIRFTEDKSKYYDALKYGVYNTSP